MSNNQIKYEHDITRQNKRQLFERGKSSYVDHGHLNTLKAGIIEQHYY